METFRGHGQGLRPARDRARQNLKPGRQGGDVKSQRGRKSASAGASSVPSHRYPQRLMGVPWTTSPRRQALANDCQAYQRFGSVENLLSPIPTSSKASKRRKLRSQPRRRHPLKKLATIFHRHAVRDGTRRSRRQTRTTTKALRRYSSPEFGSTPSAVVLARLQRQVAGRKSAGESGTGFQTCSSRPLPHLTTSSHPRWPPNSPPSPTRHTPTTSSKPPKNVKTFSKRLAEQKSYCFDLETTGLDPRDTQIVGIAFSWKAHEGWFVHFPREKPPRRPLEEFRDMLTREGIRKKSATTSKFDLGVLLLRHRVRGPFFDYHAGALFDRPRSAPRHGITFRRPTCATRRFPSRRSSARKRRSLRHHHGAGRRAGCAKVADYAAEDADVDLAARREDAAWS